MLVLILIYENQISTPTHTTEPPVWDMLGASWGRFLCTAPEHMSYRGRGSGGGWGNYGS